MRHPQVGLHQIASAEHLHVLNAVVAFPLSIVWFGLGIEWLAVVAGFNRKSAIARGWLARLTPFYDDSLVLLDPVRASAEPRNSLILGRVPGEVAFQLYALISPVALGMKTWQLLVSKPREKRRSEVVSRLAIYSALPVFARFAKLSNVDFPTWDGEPSPNLVARFISLVGGGMLLLLSFFAFTWGVICVFLALDGTGGGAAVIRWFRKLKFRY